MALLLEIVQSAGQAARQPLGPGRSAVAAQAGRRYRLVDDNGRDMDPGTGVKRVGDHLVIEGLTGDRTLELTDFFKVCREETPCHLSLENFRGAASAAIGPDSIPVGALQDGSFVMHAPSTLSAAVPIAPEAETSSKSWGLVGGAALMLGALAGGGGGGSSSNSSSGTIVSSGDTTGPTATALAPAAPALTSSKLLNNASPVLSGTGTAGSTVTVSLDIGGDGTVDATYRTLVGADGRWSVALGTDVPVSGQLPSGRLAEGTTRVTAVATNASGQSTAGVTENLVVDTVAPSPPSIRPVAGDNVISPSEAAAAVTVEGNAEAGSVLTLNWLGLTRQLAASSTGAWSSTFSVAELTAGSTASAAERTVRVSSTDSFGNVSSTATSVVSFAPPEVVDRTPPAAPSIAMVAGNDVIDRAEAAAGIQITGSAEAASTVTVLVNGVVRTTLAGSSGTYSVGFALADLLGTGLTDVIARSTDAAGNVSPDASRQIRLQTAIPPAPSIGAIAGNDVVSAAEARAGVLVSGTSDPGTRVMVTWGSSSQTVVSGSNGSYGATFTSGSLPGEGPSTVSAVALASDGTASGETTRPVSVDRIAPTTPTIAAITGDNQIGFLERNAGVTLSGTAESGSTVSIIWAGTTRTVTALGGTYSATYATSSIPTSGSSGVTVSATDAAGNTSGTASQTVTVDQSATSYRGTNGNDVLSLGSIGAQNLAVSGANIDGRGGIDTVSLSGSGVVLDLTQVPSSAFDGFERINLTGSGNNILRLTVADVLDVATSNVFNSGNGWSGLGSSVSQRQLVIDGNAGDALTATGGWTLASGTVSNGGQSYAVYTSGTGSSAAMLIVDLDITRSVV